MKSGLTQPELDAFTAHKQLFPNSCIPSGYELVAKLHGRLPIHEFPLQGKYKDAGTGFQYVGELEAYDFVCTLHTVGLTDALVLAKYENELGRFPLVALPTFSNTSFLEPDNVWIADNSYHIFTTILNPELSLTGHSHLHPNGPILPMIADLVVSRIAAIAPALQIQMLTYLLAEKPQ